MAYVRVEVDLDDFNLNELLDEISDRYSSKYCAVKDKQNIEEWAKELFEIKRFNISLSLLDQMKIDLLMDNLNKITLNNLEKLI